MKVFKTNNLSFLDRVRLNNGNDKLKGLFHNLVKLNPEEAANLINDKNLYFCSLFILKPVIDKLEFFNHLSSRNKDALTITTEILKRKASNKESLSFDCNQMNYSTLKWIFETGCFDDGLSNQYDEVLDITAIHLIKSYNDKSVLPVIAEMIFSRYKKGLYIYDLVWAFFESRDPRRLIIFANRMHSTHWMDVELACKLLGFIPGIDINRNNDKFIKYLYIRNWIQENHLFMHYTGESFQQTPNPIPYLVSLEAKYLCKPVPEDSQEPLRILNEDESNLMERFKGLNKDTQILLSTCSFLLYRQNKSTWNKWIHYPVEEQIRIVLGGLS